MSYGLPFHSMLYKNPPTIPTATVVTALARSIIRSEEEDLFVLWQLKTHIVLPKSTCLSGLLRTYLAISKDSLEILVLNYLSKIQFASFILHQ